MPVFTFAPSSLARSTKAVALLVVTLLVAAVLSVFAPAVAANATTATLTVNVTGGGAKAGYVDVVLYEYNSTYGYYDYVDQKSTGTTDVGNAGYVAAAAGKVSFTGLPTGSTHKYVVFAHPWNYSDIASGNILDYAGTYLGATTKYDRLAAGLFTLSASATKTVALMPSFSISGTLYQPNASVADGVQHAITAYQLTEFGDYYYAGNVSSNDVDGTYQISGLAPGDYKLRYEPEAGTGFGGVWSGNVATRASATPLTITTASLTGQDATFQTAGVIHGTVTYNGGGFPVDAYSPSVSAESLDNSQPITDSVAYVDTVDGSYTLNLTPGTYRLYASFFDADNTEHHVWYDNAATFSVADALVVTNVSNRVADFDLGDGFVFSGTVADVATTPLADWNVELIGNYDEQTYGSTGTATASDGSFSLSPVDPGAYRVQLTDASGLDPNTYFLLADGHVTKDQNAAEIIHGVSGTVTRTVTFPVTARVTVTVYGPTGALVPHADVTLVPSVAGRLDWNSSVIATATSPTSGRYSAAGLLANEDYTVYVRNTPTGTFDQYLGGGYADDEAQLFTAKPGSNAVDFTLAPAISVSGTVLTTSGAPIKGAVILPYYFDGTGWVEVWQQITTNAFGKWSAKFLRAGSYKFLVIHPSGSKYIDAYSGNATTLDAATAVYVGPGKTASVTVKLPTGGTLSGIVTGQGGVAFTGYGLATKLIGNPTDGFTGSDQTAQYYGTMVGGKLTFKGLPTGYYAVGFGDNRFGASVFPYTFIGGSSPLDATAFAVTAGSTTTFAPVTALVHPAGSHTLSGHFTGPGASLDRYYTLYYQRVGATDVSGIVDVAPDGSYSIPDLQPGDYYLGIDTGSYFGSAPTYTYEPFAETVTMGATDTVADYSLHNVDPLLFTTEPSTSTSDVHVGESVSVNPGTTSLPVEFSYQWFRQTEGPDTRALIRGANEETYLPRPSDFGSTLFVRVTATQSISSGDFVVTTKSVSRLVSSGLVIAGLAANNTVAPEIVPSVDVKTDTVLKVKRGTWDQPGLSYTYQWSVDGSPVLGVAGSAKTYTVKPSEGASGSAITVAVVAHGANRADSAPAFSADVTAHLGTAPTIVHTPTVTVSGSTFTVSASTWSRPGTSTLNAWYVDGSDQHVIGSQFTYSGDGAVSVHPVGIKSGYDTGSVTVLAKKGAAPTVDTPPVVQKSGTPTAGTDVPVGLPLGVDAGTYLYRNGGSPTGTAYQWYATALGGSPVAIAGATSPTFVPTPANLGKVLSVKVTVTSSAYASLSTTVEGGTVVEGTLGQLTALGVSGFANEGRTLTVVKPQFLQAGVTYSYSWNTLIGVDLTPIPGATAASFTPPASFDDGGARLVVLVHVHKAGYTDVDLGSDPIEIGNGTVTNVTPPTITPGGVVTTGKVLTASAGTWDIATPTVTYQWKRNGADIALATAKTYMLTAADEGQNVTVEVLAAKAGFPTSDPVASSNTVIGHAASVSVSAPAILATLVLTGAPVVGEATGTTQSIGQLFDYPGDDSAANGTLTYQWLLAGSPIAGATSASYIPTPAAAGKMLSLKVTATSPYFAKATQTTTPTPVGTGGQTEGTVGIDDIGGAVYGGKLVAVVAGWAPTSALTYQWQRNGVNIPGATAATHPIVGADVDADLRVTVTAKRTGYTTVQVTTLPQHIDFIDSITWFESPTITGTAVTGGTLTVNPGTVSVTGAVYSYRWLANNTPIPGATSSSIVISPALAGHTLSVAVTANKVGYKFATIESSAAPVAEATAAIIAGKVPKIVVDNSTCNRIMATPGTWSVGGMAFSYKWYRGLVGDTSTLLAETAGYDMSPLNIGLSVWVKVSAHGTGYSGTANTTAFTETPTGACG